jgi:S-formylglutathione hydrolase FrmB
MASLVCNFFSEALEVGVSVSVVLPQATVAQIGVEARVTPGALPVLYLLHGLSDDHTAWTRYTAIERYATERGIAVVMPAAGRSFYADEVHGHRYWSYVSEELPRVVGEFFRVSQAPEDTFVAGLSMGGYGALKLVLTHPDRFAAAASLSGGIDVREITKRPERRELLDRVWGGSIPPDADLFALLEQATDLPPLYLSCGTDDVLYDGCVRFADAAEAKGVDVTTDWRPGGHEWPLWDAVIADVIRWLPVGG